MQEQVALFADRLPRRPYCSDDKTARLIRGRAAALRFPYIQVNPPKLRFWLPFDLDEPGGALAWEHANLPPPAAAITNPHNGHAHLLWGLDAPVCTSDAARIAPLRYLAAIEAGMFAALRPFGADPGFAGLMVKNPTHAHWRTLWGPAHLYSLEELAEWVPLDRHKPKTPKLADLEAYGVGRNVALFSALGPEGKWAYEAVRRFRGEPYAAWETAVLVKAQELNGEFPAPLQYNEVRHIARSVAKWTWKQDKGHVTKFRQRQSYRGALGGEASGRARRAASAGKRARAREFAAQGHSQVSIAAKLGVTERTVRNWLKH